MKRPSDITGLVIVADMKTSLNKDLWRVRELYLVCVEHPVHQAVMDTLETNGLRMYWEEWEPRWCVAAEVAKSSTFDYTSSSEIPPEGIPRGRHNGLARPNRATHDNV